MTAICIIIQSPGFVSSAGMRIRYLRFMAAAAPYGADITYAVISDLLEAKSFSSDIYIFSKTFAPEAVVLACRLKGLGKVIGQDVFDDYFSQTDDARLARFQHWMMEMEPFTDFVVGTTERLQSILAKYLPRAPISIVPDPVEKFDKRQLEELLSGKLDAAIAARRLSVCWFGIGDNPFFSVGVRDLFAHGDELARLKWLGWDVDLTVLTNTRALSAEGLALLRSMSIDFRIEEWTEEREDESLRAADVAFIPVSGQGFSRAKSLNRCLTALLRGCQVLARGFPLYRLADEFIYKSAEELVADLDQGRAKLEATRLPRLYELLDAHADPTEAAAAFVKAAVSTPPGGARKASGAGAGPLFCLVHGRTSDTSLHKLAVRSGGLSVGGPFQSKNLNYQLRFDCIDGELRCRIEKSRMKVLSDKLRARAIEIGRIIDFDFCELPIGDLAGTGAAVRMVVGQGRFDWLATYPDVIRTIKLVCRSIFPAAAVIVSEQNELALAALRRDAGPNGEPSIREGVA